MQRPDSSSERLTIPHFETFRQHDAEIVQRVGRRANGGRLLVIDL